ncbi:MAG: hypothetical protein K2G25_04575, partial [Oscillospiraceae bacterium]|nr:hypothetical protein [Oscillospiraceae bacterium]
MAYKKESFVDYYHVLNINKELSTQEIKNILIAEQKKWSQRTNTPSDSKIMKAAQETLDIVNAAMRTIGNKNKRPAYDKEWEKRKAQGMLETEKTVEAANIVERAVQYYQEGNLKLAEKFAREALQTDGNNITAYDV